MTTDRVSARVVTSTARTERSAGTAAKPTRESSVVGRTVQDAIYRTIHHSEGHPPKVIAEEMGLASSILYDIADENRERRLRAEEIPALVKATGCFAILDVIEARVGRVAFHVPPDSMTLREESALAIDAIREFGEVLEVFTTAVRDGKVSAAEAHAIAEQADEAIAAIARIKASAASAVTDATGGAR